MKWDSNNICYRVKKSESNTQPERVMEMNRNNELERSTSGDSNIPLESPWFLRYMSRFANRKALVGLKTMDMIQRTRQIQTAIEKHDIGQQHEAGLNQLPG